MKKNDFLILLSTAAYSFLFYNENAGLNFLIFNIVVVVLLIIQKRELLHQWAWLAACAGSMISAAMVFYWGTDLPVIANVCSLLILGGFSFNPQSSLLVAAFHSGISIAGSIPILLSRVFLPKPNAEPKPKNFFKKLGLFIVPLFITFLFFSIYRAANPIFQKFTDRIDFDFVNWGWVTFTFGGFIIMMGFFRQAYFEGLKKADDGASDALAGISSEEHAQSEIGKMISVNNEFISGIILFALLNLLLLVVNSLDIFYMWIVNRLPDGVGIAEYLHDGTDTLIFSIIMAIAVILFVFRGYLNFFENNKWLKLLCYGWIAQNVILIITTANRNWWIIESSGLTRKRIGVYVYLLLCLIGLATTFIKVMSRKSNWFLFRKNAWAFYAVFIIACLFNWDNIIVQYNCRNFKALELDYIDRGYMAELSHTCLASLCDFYIQEKQEKEPKKKIFTPQVIAVMHYSFMRLERVVKGTSWKSYSVSRQKNYEVMKDLIDKHEFIYTPVAPLDSLKPEKD